MCYIKTNGVEGNMEKEINSLIEKYEKFLKNDENCNLDEYEKGAHNELLAVVYDLKDVLNHKNSTEI